MKARLIINAVLSIINLIILIILIEYIFTPSQGTWNLYNRVFIVRYIVTGLSIMMGILTLAMKKHPDVRGLTIASGGLALFGGVFGINAIISLMGVSQIPKNKDIC